MKYEIIDSHDREPIGAAFRTESEAAEYIREARGLGYAYRASRDRLTDGEIYNAGILQQSLGVDPLGGAR